MKELGSKLKGYRLTTGLSVVDFAYENNVLTTVIKDLEEKNKVYTIKDFILVSNIMGKDVDDLIEECYPQKAEYKELPKNVQEISEFVNWLLMLHTSFNDSEK